MGLVEKLQAKIETLKEKEMHMQRQQPKPKKKAKRAVLNVWKQKTKFKKPKLTAMNQPKPTKATPMEAPCLGSNKKCRGTEGI